MKKIIFVQIFYQSNLQLKEKVLQKTIKLYKRNEEESLYSPTFQEFYDFLTQLRSKNVKQIIDEYLITKFDLQAEDFDYKQFKNGTQINLSFPTVSELNSEITEEQINNGLLAVFVKEIEINNKDLQIIMEPCTFGIYNQLACITEKRNCTSKELTNILYKKYQVQFQLI